MARPKGSTKVPAYRLHKPSGRAIVQFPGEPPMYIGKHGTPESKAEYSRAIAEWASRGCRSPVSVANGLTIAEMIAGFMNQAKQYYAPQSLGTFIYPFRALVEMYGDTKAADFGPQQLKAVRTARSQAPTKRIGRSGKKLTRRWINAGDHYIKIAFKWAAEADIVPISVYWSLRSVKALQPLRTPSLTESAEVLPVDDVDINAVVSRSSAQVTAMIRLQLYTGMRPGEVCGMQGKYLRCDGEVWIYEPKDHKTAWRGKIRTIFLGPKAQEEIRPFLKMDPEAYLFSPRDAWLTKRYPASWGNSKDRSTKHSARARTTAAKRAAPGYCPRISARFRERYTTENYSSVIRTNCDRADLDQRKKHPEAPADKRFVKRWHPHQLRHNAATYLVEEFGWETARIILGHSSVEATKIYAKRGSEAAIKAIQKVG